MNDNTRYVAPSGGAERAGEGPRCKTFYALIRAGLGEFQASAFGDSRINALRGAMARFKEDHPKQIVHHRIIWAYLFRTMPAPITYSPSLKNVVHDALVIDQASCFEVRLDVINAILSTKTPESLEETIAVLEDSGGMAHITTALHIPDVAYKYILSLDQADSLGSGVNNA